MDQNRHVPNVMESQKASDELQRTRNIKQAISAAVLERRMDMKISAKLRGDPDGQIMESWLTKDDIFVTRGYAFARKMLKAGYIHGARSVAHMNPQRLENLCLILMVRTILVPRTKCGRITTWLNMECMGDPDGPSFDRGSLLFSLRAHLAGAYHIREIREWEWWMDALF